jgi:serine phosphatase RsbU (regulator of sigma subunit)
MGGVSQPSERRPGQDPEHLDLGAGRCPILWFRRARQHHDPSQGDERTDAAHPTDELDRLGLLRHAGDALSVALDIGEALSRLAEVIVPALADWFSVDLVEDGTITNVLVMHPDPERVELARELQRRFPSDPDAPSGSPHVIRTGEPELTESITDDMLLALIDDPDLLTTIRELGLRCAMVVPLTARGRTIGSITMIGAETHERYGAFDLRLAEEIADRAALAIDTARLFAAENDARLAALDEAHRNEILKDSTAAFGDAGSVDEVVSAMLEQGIRRSGATGGAVGILEDGDRVLLAGLTGYEPQDEPYWHEFRLDDPLPMSDAIRDRRVVVLSTTADRNARYPAIAGRGEQRDHALVCVPLVLGGAVIGGFSASYPPGMAFGDSDLSLLLSIGEQCAQAVDRARARQASLAARARLDAVAAASKALAQTLDVDATVATVKRLATEHLGSSITLLRFGRGGAVTVEAGEAVAASEETIPDVDEIVGLVSEARERGRPYAVAPRPGAPDPSKDRILVLPLEIAGRVAGAVVVGDPTIDLDDLQDLSFAAEIARRMTRALENARLYQDRDDVARTLQAALLPPTLPEVPGLEVETLFVPAERGVIGGDFFDVFPIKDGRWVALVGDVCGKGIEAATLTAMARHTLRALANVQRPSEALAALNDALLREDLDGRFCTVALAMIDPQTDDGPRIITVSSGGHPLPQHLSNDGVARRVGEHGTLLGIVEDITLTDAVVPLEAGEALVMFTDGLIAKRETSGDQPDRLLTRLRGRRWRSAAEIREHIRGFIEELGADRYDDIAVLVLRVPD